MRPPCRPLPGTRSIPCCRGLRRRVASSGATAPGIRRSEAQAHLRRKLDYLVDKGAIASTEQFIERAASRSSVSGQAYQVKCGGNQPVPSGTWLYAELKALRAETRQGF